MLVIVGIADYHNDDLCYLCGDNDGGSVAESGESAGTKYTLSVPQKNSNKQIRNPFCTNDFWILGGFSLLKNLGV